MSIITELSHEDHMRLRTIVRSIGAHYLAADDSDAHVDKIIETLAPKVVEDMIRRAVDRRLLG